MEQQQRVEPTSEGEIPPGLDEEKKEDISDVGAGFTELDMYEAEMESMPDSSKRQMFDQGAKFQQFANSNGVTDLLSIDDRQLNDILRRYYHQLRSTKNEAYSPASLVCLRSTNLVAKNTAFDSSNRMLNCKIRDYIASGAETKHFNPIEDGDMIKRRSNFNRCNGERLQDEIIFKFLYELGEREFASTCIYY
jgi:hypothetical protein